MDKVTECGVCGRKLCVGDEAFFDASQGYRCHDITCDR